MLTCKQCNKTFTKAEGVSLQKYCNAECRKEAVKGYRHKYFHRYHYEIELPPEEFLAWYNAQPQRCKICYTNKPGGRKVRFAVDHDHKTGKLRGLLCENCNLALGHLRDDIDTLIKMIAYLRGEL